jgi:hypothetical protein
MKPVLTFEATPRRSGGVLLELAMVLRENNLTPELLEWRAPVSDTRIRARLILREADEVWLPAIADRVMTHPDVRKAEVRSEEI